VSSPEIVYLIAKNRVIAKDRALECLCALKKIGWFSDIVLNFVRMEVEKLE